MDTKPTGHAAVGRHETRDANLKAIVKFVIGLLVLLVVVFLAMRGTFLYFRAKQSLGPPASPFVNSRPLPPGPNLLVAATRDLNQLRASEDRLLEGYAWIDKKAGRVRIPIDRAMEILAAKGLPVRTVPKPQAVKPAKGVKK